jgi:hypothetical protein
MHTPKAMPETNISPPTPEAQEGSASDRLRALLVSSGLSLPEAARALSVDEKTLLYWCQPNGKLLPPRSAIEMLARLVGMKKKAKL